MQALLLLQRESQDTPFCINFSFNKTVFHSNVYEHHPSTSTVLHSTVGNLTDIVPMEHHILMS